jgi:hypothetical protein
MDLGLLFIIGGAALLMIAVVADDYLNKKQERERDAGENK